MLWILSLGQCSICATNSELQWFSFLYIKRKFTKIFLKPLFVCGSSISVQLSSVLGVNSVAYEVRSSVFVAELVLCLEHWCPLVDWSSSINRLNLFLHSWFITVTNEKCKHLHFTVTLLHKCIITVLAVFSITEIKTTKWTKREWAGYLSFEKHVWRKTEGPCSCWRSKTGK